MPANDLSTSRRQDGPGNVSIYSENNVINLSSLAKRILVGSVWAVASLTLVGCQTGANLLQEKSIVASNNSKEPCRFG